MQNRFLDFISQKKLFTSKEKILLALSGGIDSIVLFDLLLKGKFIFSVAHCNFGLRGKESAVDEKFVQALCKKHKIVCYTERFQTSAYAEKKGISTQMAARDLRYAWFEKLRKENQFDFIATAHHQTDVAETMLINLLRGTGIAGLHGISEKNNKVIRPLLFAGRGDITVYASNHKLAYREDSSNAGDDYLRNKIRHHVLPELHKINETFEQQFFESAAHIAGAEAVYNQAIEAKRQEIEEKEKNGIRFSISKLKQLKPLSIYLYEFLKPYHFSAAQCLDIEKCMGKTSGKQFYSLTHRLLTDRAFLLLSRNSSPLNAVPYFIEAKHSEMDYPVHLKISAIDLSADFKISKLSSYAQVDAAKIKFPLQLRKWQSGDSFQPFGMKGQKKLSDFFIDNKLSIFEKEKIWLLCSGNQVVWIINHRIDDRFKISAKTKKIIQFQFFEK